MCTTEKSLKQAKILPESDRHICEYTIDDERVFISLCIRVRINYHLIVHVCHFIAELLEAVDQHRCPFLQAVEQQKCLSTKHFVHVTRALLSLIALSIFQF